MTEQKTKAEKLLDKYNLNEDELEHILKQTSKPKQQRNNLHEQYGGSRRTKIGIISDTHYGHKHFREDIHNASVNRFNKEKVDAVYHCGDIIEGMSNREGHVYELDKLGITEQMKLAKDCLNDYKQPVNFIIGNHDDWAMKKSNQGYNVGEQLEQVVKNAKYLGDYSADVMLHPKVKLRLSHEGNTAYALSYSSQKRINSLDENAKPDIICNGHLHKALYMLYRNIHAFEAGTLQEQTYFMRMKGSPAMTGFWVLDIRYNKNGINEIKPTYYPFD